MVGRALQELGTHFEALHARRGRPSRTPKHKREGRSVDESRTRLGDLIWNPGTRLLYEYDLGELPVGRSISELSEVAEHYDVGDRVAGASNRDFLAIPRPRVGFNQGGLGIEVG
jgi:hypothetical protein